MTKRHLSVVDGGGDNRGGGSHDVAVARVDCRECRFVAERCYENPEGSGRLWMFHACMVNAEQRCSLHNPEGLCVKFEAVPDELDADMFMIFRIVIILMVLVGVMCLGLWLLFG